MQAPIIAAHTKILFSLIAGAGLGAVAYLDLNQNEPMIALITACLSFVLVLNGLYLLMRKGQNTSSYLEWLFIFLLASFSLLAASHQGQMAIHWVYFFPLAAFFLFKLNTAIILVLIYVPLALYIIFDFGQTLDRFQMVFSFTAISLVAFFLAIIQERTNLMLEPLISTDIITGAFQYERLKPALTTEINRAEREGTGLLLMIIQTGQAIRKHNKDYRTRLLQACANSIGQQLRPFDSCYRLPTDDFAMILPHTTTQDAKSVAQAMLMNIPAAMGPQSLPIGFASLNADDDADSLMEIAEASKGPLHV